VSKAELSLSKTVDRPHSEMLARSFPLRCCLLLLSFGCTSATVIGIDLGARFLKVGLIQVGPKGLELVLNEATQRKSASAAGFTLQDERVYGNEAQGLLGRAPKQVFIMSKLLLGQPLDSVAIEDFKRYLYPYNFETDPEFNTAVLRYSEDSTFRGEEMVAFVLSYAKQIAEGHSGSSVRDCVITIPPFFGYLERMALYNAAKIAGLNVLSLMHEGSAFALKFGFDKQKEFTEEPTNVVLLDLGASSYKVTVVGFQQVVGKKNQTTGSMTIKGLGWDKYLGGKDFDQVVLDMIAMEFNEKVLKGKDDVRNYPRAVGKMRKTAESCKDILSANTMYQVGVEALHDDRDLRMVIKRETFVEMAEERGLWARLLPPIERAIAMANLSKEEVHRVEVIGGATRIPQVQATAKEFFGRKTLDGALNGDEAGALGSTLFAAKHATQFKLREFIINDAFPYASSVRISGQNEAAAEEESEEAAESKRGKDKLLFKAMSKMPHKKVIKSTRTDDILVHLSVGDASAGETLEPMALFNITGVAAGYARLQKDEKREVVGKPSVAITFSLSSSGLIDVTKAEMSIETLETYEEMVAVNATDEEAANSTDAEAEATGAADAEAPAETPTDEAADANSTDANGTAVNKTKPIKYVPVQKQRKAIKWITLKSSKEMLGTCQPLSDAEVNKCIKRNADMLIEEKRRRTNAEAKNGLESFIIDTRDKIGDEAMEQVSTEEERESLRTQFNELEDWLYGDGMSLDAKEYTKRKKELSAQTSPIFLRFSEMTDRPAAVEAAVTD